MLRSAALALAFSLLPSFALAQDDPEMAAAFNALSPADRAAVQEELREMNFYGGPIDGAWGQDMLVAVFIAWDSLNMTGGTAPAYGSPDGATTVMAMIRSGEVGDHLEAWMTSDAVKLN